LRHPQANKDTTKVNPPTHPPTPQALFSLPLPPSGGKLCGHSTTGGGHAAASSLVVPSTPTIAGLQDEMLLMSSLQRPKKITFLGRCAVRGGWAALWVLGGGSVAVCVWGGGMGESV